MLYLALRHHIENLNVVVHADGHVLGAELLNGVCVARTEVKHDCLVALVGVTKEPNDCQFSRLGCMGQAGDHG